MKKNSFTIGCLFFSVVFASLGIWQLQRKAEKETVLRIIEQNRNAPPYDVDAIKEPALFHPLIATGSYLPGKTIFLSAKTYQGKLGFYLLDVFQTQGGQFLLVQRGWSSVTKATPPQGKITLEGIMRVPSTPNYFQPANKSPTYFWIDLKTISKDLGISLLPYYMISRTSSDPQVLLTDPFPLLRNPHLTYAITWFFLAFILLFMLKCCRKATH